MATTKVSRNPEEVIVPRQEIVGMLEKHQVPWKSWGAPGTTSRTLHDFFKYHETDRLYLRNGAHGKNGSSDKFIIDVHAAIVIVMHRINRKWLELYEDRQVFDDNPEPLIRSGFNGIAETAKRTETMSETAKRCVTEELKFADPSKYEMSECVKIEHREIAPSEKWPGVWAAYHRHIFECVISRQLFLPDGYVEREGIRTIYFKWKQLNQSELRV